jgi:hypothetical protein
MDRIKIQTTTNGNRHFKVVSSVPILDATGLVAQIKAYERVKTDGFVVVLYIGDDILIGLDRTVKRAFHDVADRYKEWKQQIGGTSTRAAIVADLEPAIESFEAGAFLNVNEENVE